MPTDKKKVLEALETALQDSKDKARAKKQSENVVTQLQEKLVSALAPVMKGIADDLRNAVKEMKVEVPPVEVKVPEMKMPQMPEVRVPAPVVNLPAPVVNVPKTEFPAFPSDFALRGVDAKRPLPVLLHGTDGKPLLNLMSPSGNSSNFITVKQFLTPNGDSMVDETNDALNVNVVAGSLSANTEYTEGDTDATLTGIVQMAEAASDTVTPLQVGSGVADKALRVVHATDVAQSVSLTSQATGTELTDDFLRTVLAQDQAYSVNIVSGSSAGTEYTEGDSDASVTGTALMAEGADNDGNRDVLRVAQMGNGVDSSAIRFVHASNVGVSVQVNSSDVSFEVKQVSGQSDSVSVLDFNGNAPATGLNETTDGFLRVILPTDYEGSVAAHTHALDSTGAWEQVRTDAGVAVGAMRVVQAVDSASSVNVTGLAGDTPSKGLNEVDDGFLRVILPTSFEQSVVVNSFTSSVVTEGTAVADAADDGSAPHKMGGIARTANPTAVADGDRVSATFDDVGRQVMTIGQVRDLRKTAYASLNSNAETSLISGVASAFLDMIYFSGANTSDQAVTVDVRCGTGGTVIQTFELPANATQGFTMPGAGLPMVEAAQAWTVDFQDSDISNTTVHCQGLFDQNV